MAVDDVFQISPLVLSHPTCAVSDTTSLCLGFVRICVLLPVPRVAADRVSIELLNFLAGPVGSSKELQTAVDTWVAGKAADIDAVP